MHTCYSVLPVYASTHAIVYYKGMPAHALSTQGLRGASVGRPRVDSYTWTCVCTYAENRVCLDSEPTFDALVVNF
jgi:hypothetical protein